MNAVTATRYDAEIGSEIIQQFAAQPEMLVQILRGFLERYRYVPDEAIAQIASELNLSRADVHGVVSFYHDFRRAAPGRSVVQICQAESCQAMGSRALTAHAMQTLGIGLHETTADGSVTLEPVYCLGNCACSPAIMIDEQVYGRVDAETFDRLCGNGFSRDSSASPMKPLPQEPLSDQPVPHPVRVFVPRETTAVSLGADEVATALAVAAADRGRKIDVVRNGSLGMSWLEPLVEVDTDGVRMAYGPVRPEDVEDLLDSGLLDGGDHPLGHGPTASIPYLARQQRWTFRRVGRIDPLSIDAYREHGGFDGLLQAFANGAEQTLAAVTESGLRGRGGAGFPTGRKWQTVAEATAEQKYIACNADEGDSGTFSDRLLMEGDPFALIEGLLIAGYTVGASRGYVYLRSEYPLAREVFGKALSSAREHGWLGTDIRDSGFDFDIELHIGAGSYVCGEETAMLDSLEGKAGLVRFKPPLPALEGLFGEPTVVNNVITLASVPDILLQGAERYAALGIERSRGTLAFQLAGNIKRGGLVEVEFGMSLRDIIMEFGGGTASGRPLRAVQVGGPLGAYLPASELDIPLDYEAFAARDALIGHGGIVVFDDTVDMAAQARFAMEFCAIESCGKCTPCRIGSVRGVEVIDRIVGDQNRDANLALLGELCDTMVDGSLCAMGGLTPYPVRSALKYFSEDFTRTRSQGAGGKP